MNNNFEKIKSMSLIEFKEINKENHTIIKIEEVYATKIIRDWNVDDGDRYYVKFYIGYRYFDSEYFDTEKEAIQFRNEIMGWNKNN